ncbi:thiolase family protein [Streptomyces sp. GQFP]|uniref:thiolase family protein n=1 Tax=Streptomyces sp. GQFP TaxID=2907545 RepID=UPI001F2D7755|nr:thiolase family protein [Streptomyces sp. GQFP]UIX29285.1 thiolase family protein [Streptomyces sp. GQFP]
MTFADDRAVVTGIGQSRIGRRLGRTGIDLALEAAEVAVRHAGLTFDDIDGVASYPGPVAAEDGFVGATTHDVRDAFGLRTRWHTSSVETSGQIGTLLDAAAAIATGRATHVLCFRSVWEATAQAKGRAAALTGKAQRASGHAEFRVPFGAASPANWIAMYAQRYMHDFGLTREQLGKLVVNTRTNAGRNPQAIYREPMTLEEYLDARLISWPFGLYDCDVPCDGATAIILSRREETAGLPNPPISIEAAGAALYERHTWDQRADLTTMAAHDAARSMWETTTMTPSDVDFATLYDGFSYLCTQWIEALGFCEHGKVGQFLDDVDTYRLDGTLPINPHGGQLSAGRMHGYGFLHEACLQLWRQAGERQIAKDVRTVAVGIGGGPEAGCLLLHRAG